MSFWTVSRIQDTATYVVLPLFLRDMGNMKAEYPPGFQIRLKHFRWSGAEYLSGWAYGL